MLRPIASVLVTAMLASGCAYIARISLDSSGAESNGSSGHPAVSGDGRFVAFHSDASNLVAGDTNGTRDVFVRDTVTGTTTRVSIDDSGAEGDDGSGYPSISADGRRVAFESDATNLVALEELGNADVFLHDLDTGTTEQVSVATDGTPWAHTNTGAALSGDGRHVAFLRFHRCIGFIFLTCTYQLWVRDTILGITTQITDPGAKSPSISADGRHVAWAVNYSEAGSPGSIYVRDTGTGATTQIATGPNSSDTAPAISADGRFVAFSRSEPVVEAPPYFVTLDVFVHDMVDGTTTQLTADLLGNPSSGTDPNIFVPPSLEPAMSADGAYVAFRSNATTLVPDDTNAAWDVFVKRTVQPDITSVSPATASPGTSITLTVNGTGFADVTGALVIGTGVDVTSVSVLSDTDLEVDVAIDADAPYGTRDLIVYDGGNLGLGTGASDRCATCLTIE